MMSWQPACSIVSNGAPRFILNRFQLGFPRRLSAHLRMFLFYSHLNSTDCNAQPMGPNSAGVCCKFFFIHSVILTLAGPHRTAAAKFSLFATCLLTSHYLQASGFRTRSILASNFAATRLGKAIATAPSGLGFCAFDIHFYLAGVRSHRIATAPGRRRPIASPSTPLCSI
jgi:hypothetical protein